MIANYACRWINFYSEELVWFTILGSFKVLDNLDSLHDCVACHLIFPHGLVATPQVVLDCRPEIDVLLF